jgi:large subunit ribosomal protein L2
LGYFDIWRFVILGKRIRVQRRGRASLTFQSSTHKRVAPARYPNPIKEKLNSAINGNILEFIHEPGRGSPLARINLDGKICYLVVPEGVHEGQAVELGKKASVRVGNIIPIGNIPEGTMVCNIELSPGDGGKLARSSGSYALVVSHTPEGTMLKLPSGRTRYVNNLCLATIGVVSGAGRTEKPFLKAGSKYHFMKAKGHKYPRTRGRAMIAAVHPFGSGRRGGRKVTTVSRNAPPGKKVGLIAARSAGKRKK